MLVLAPGCPETCFSLFAVQLNAHTIGGVTSGVYCRWGTWRGELWYTSNGIFRQFSTVLSIMTTLQGILTSMHDWQGFPAGQVTWSRLAERRCMVCVSGALGVRMAGENLRVCSEEPAAQLVCFPRQVCNARWKYLHVGFIEDILSLLHVVKADDLLIHSIIICVCTLLYKTVWDFEGWIMPFKFKFNSRI